MLYLEEYNVVRNIHNNAQSMLFNKKLSKHRLHWNILMQCSGDIKSN